MVTILKPVRKVLSYLGVNPRETKVDFKGQKASDVIATSLKSNEPFLVARIGATEFNCVSGYLNENKGTKRYIDYVTGRTNCTYIDKNIINQAFLWSGIFPEKRAIVEQFAQITLKDLEEVDILGVWLKEDCQLKKQLKGKIKIPLADIEPYYHENPWSKELKNKKVLVIHPFAETIHHQYKSHEKLFTNPNILPSFELKTLKAVQSIAGQDVEFPDWFAALDHMKKRMDNIDFDVAIIGCGAYGLSLGAHAKRMGKQAIHIGGATQILFGIKGSRWDNHPIISKLYNEHWSRPSDVETPKNKDKVEEGCYW